MLSCIWVYDKEGFVRSPAGSNEDCLQKGEELILLSLPIDPDPSRRGEVNIFQLIELDSTRISALVKVS